MRTTAHGWRSCATTWAPQDAACSARCRRGPRLHLPCLTCRRALTKFWAEQQPQRIIDSDRPDSFADTITPAKSLACAVRVEPVFVQTGVLIWGRSASLRCQSSRGWSGSLGWQASSHLTAAQCARGPPCRAMSCSSVGRDRPGRNPASDAIHRQPLVALPGWHYQGTSTALQAAGHQPHPIDCGCHTRPTACPASVSG